MRILSVRFKNLNSLAGEWEVDFTHPAYLADGIFAITGPTGAGKTTLLDAICLALYAETPRLGAITQSSNEIMSRQTGECFAEVTFSTQEGSFRCHWSQHRARKQADGKLQIARHEIADAMTGKIIDNQIRTVKDRIEKITGMDFGRFTQSMMLAQGGFAAFLEAKADQRSEILEQITGTEIYSDISRQVHLRHAEVRNTLQSLESELKGKQLLTPEQELQLKTEEEQLTEKLVTQQSQEDEARQQRDWKKLCLDLQARADRLEQDHAAWQAQDKAFTPKRETLTNAVKALELSADHASLNALRAEQQTDAHLLAAARTRLPELQEKSTAAQQQHETAIESLKVAENRLREMRPVFKQVHLLDQQIIQTATQERALAEEQQGLESEYKNHTAAITRLRQTIANTQEQLLTDFPDAGGDFSRLLDIATDRLEKIQAQAKKLTDAQTQALQGQNIDQWRQKKEQINEQRTQLSTLQEKQISRQKAAVVINDLNESVRNNTLQLQSLTTELRDATALTRAHENTVAALRQQEIQQQRILSLEEQRRQLQEGEPCPLCGATDHPFAEHNPLDSELDKNIRSAQDAVNTAKQRADELGTQQIRLQSQCDHDQKLLERETDNLKQLEQTLSTLFARLQITPKQDLQTFEQNLLTESGIVDRVIRTAEQLDSDIRDQERQANLANQTLTDIRSALKDIQHNNAGITEHQSRITALEDAIKRSKTAIASNLTTQASLRTNRQSLLGDRDADQEESALESAVQSAQAHVQQQQHVLTRVQHELRDTQQSVTALELRISEREKNINSQHNQFIARLNTQGFTSEEQFLSARLSEAQRRQLQEQHDTLVRQGIELQGAMQQNQQELAAQLALKLSEASLDTLQQQFSEQEQHTRQLQEQLGGIRQALRSNEQQRQQQLSLTEQIDKQKLEAERWARLHELIGSADGKKFRNFAQGLTFDMMIAHANQQLQRMTDRYLLLRDREQPLDLNVIDNYQAGEIRSTKNLSGGESFIVSLTLALGLSRMASRNVRVDSLFLDEGFGTLDEDALDTALETLSNLQQEGKLIGIISHVSALKERIATQIKVSPIAGGRSSISGPGCYNMSS